MTPDGYPNDHEIEQIRTWVLPGDLSGLVEFVRQRWRWEYGWRSSGRNLWMSTGGWSGNEEIIGALQENRLFWSMCWVYSRRGGHYRFNLHPALQQPPAGEGGKT